MNTNYTDTSDGRFFWDWSPARRQWVKIFFTWKEIARHGIYA